MFPHQDIPNQNIPHHHIPNQDIPYQDILSQDIPHQDILNQDVPHQDIPNQDIPHQDVPNQDIPHQDIPNQDIPNQDIPHQDADYQDIINQWHLAVRPPQPGERQNQRLWPAASHAWRCSALVCDVYVNVVVGVTCWYLQHSIPVDCISPQGGATHHHTSAVPRYLETETKPCVL